MAQVWQDPSLEGWISLFRISQSKFIWIFKDNKKSRLKKRGFFSTKENRSKAYQGHGSHSSLRTLKQSCRSETCALPWLNSLLQFLGHLVTLTLPNSLTNPRLNRWSARFFHIISFFPSSTQSPLGSSWISRPHILHKIKLITRCHLFSYLFTFIKTYKLNNFQNCCSSPLVWLLYTVWMSPFCHQFFPRQWECFQTEKNIERVIFL